MKLESLLKGRTNRLEIYGLPKIKVKSTSDFAKKYSPKIEEKHNLNYTIVTTINAELTATLLFLSEKGLIQSKDLGYFEKLASEDYSHLCRLYKKHGKERYIIGEYETIKNLFYSYAERSISAFQKQSEPLLIDILSAIYTIEYISIAVPKIVKVMGRIPERKTFRIIEEKSKDLKNAFLKLYTPLSNQKSFDFNRFTEVFHLITEMNHNEFKNYINKNNGNNKEN
ncbi:hypothetical protein JZ968_06735 [Riemerella anatipestifer]